MDLTPVDREPVKVGEVRLVNSNVQTVRIVYKSPTVTTFTDIPGSPFDATKPIKLPAPVEVCPLKQIIRSVNFD